MFSMVSRVRVRERERERERENGVPIRQFFLSFYIPVLQFGEKNNWRGRLSMAVWRREEKNIGKKRTGKKT